MGMEHALFWLLVCIDCAILFLDIYDFLSFVSEFMIEVRQVIDA